MYYIYEDLWGKNLDKGEVNLLNMTLNQHIKFFRIFFGKGSRIHILSVKLRIKAFLFGKYMVCMWGIVRQTQPQSQTLRHAHTNTLTLNTSSVIIHSKATIHLEFFCVRTSSLLLFSSTSYLFVSFQLASLHNVAVKMR